MVKTWAKTFFVLYLFLVLIALFILGKLLRGCLIATGIFNPEPREQSRATSRQLLGFHGYFYGRESAPSRQRQNFSRRGYGHLSSHSPTGERSGFRWPISQHINAKFCGQYWYHFCSHNKITDSVLSFQLIQQKGILLRRLGWEYPIRIVPIQADGLDLCHF